jgi:TolA-binding protein
MNRKTAGILVLLLALSFQSQAMPSQRASRAKAPTGMAASLPEGERAIYLSLIDAYRKGDLKQTYRFRDLMIKNFRTSIYADNALYLTGLLDMQRGRMAEAVRNFGQLIDNYPRGNKRSAAMYGKSMAYSKLNLPVMSKQVLEKIIVEYPGSPESQRAWIDLRLKKGV